MTPTPVGVAPEAVADTVLAVPGVAGLHPGRFGEVATYLPGRRVVGVRVDGDLVEVHVVVWWHAHVLDTAEAIRRALSSLGASAVDVVVQDVIVVDDHPDDRRRPARPARSTVPGGEAP